MGHRHDIDGLRGVAILLAVAYHAFPQHLVHGYLGVDVFFVISGYLITQQLVQAQQAGCIQVGPFYARRVRRLFPALIVVLACTLGAGWLSLYPDEYERLGLHTAAASVFMLNLQLWSEVGYFDVQAQLKPLLHLWSLSVEEQFYLVWPLFLLLASRRGASGRWAWTVALSLASALLWAALVVHDATAGFYLPLARFWELGAGALVALSGGRPRVRGGHAGWGLLMLAAAVAVAAGAERAALGHAGWQQAWRLPVAVLGSCLIIDAANRTGFASRLLGWAPLRGLGLISFSLYLWHWPMLSLLRLRLPAGQEPDAVSTTMALLLSVLLATVSWRLVEQPIRRKAADWRLVTGLVAGMLVVGGAGLLTSLRAGWPERVPEHAEDRKRMADWDYPSTGMRADVIEGVNVQQVGGQGPQTLFIGDSSIEQYGPRVARLLAQGPMEGRGAIFLTQGGQFPLSGVQRIDGQVSQWSSIERVLQDRRVDRVVIGAAWALYLHPDKAELGLGGPVVPRYYWQGQPLDEAAGRQGVLAALTEQLMAMRSRGLEVTLVGSIPAGAELATQPPGQARPWRLRDLPPLPEQMPREPFDRRLSPLAEALQAAAHAASAQWVDPRDSLCDASTCPRRLFKDIGHLRASVVREEVHYLDHTVRP